MIRGARPRIRCLRSSLSEHYALILELPHTPLSRSPEIPQKTVSSSALSVALPSHCIPLTPLWSSLYCVRPHSVHLLNNSGQSSAVTHHLPLPWNQRRQWCVCFVVWRKMVPLLTSFHVCVINFIIWGQERRSSSNSVSTWHCCMSGCTLFLYTLADWPTATVKETIRAVTSSSSAEFGFLSLTVNNLNADTWFDV